MIILNFIYKNSIILTYFLFMLVEQLQVAIERLFKVLTNFIFGHSFRYFELDSQIVKLCIDKLVIVHNDKIFNRKIFFDSIQLVVDKVFQRYVEC